MYNLKKKIIFLACSQLACTLAVNYPAPVIHQVVSIRSHSATKPLAAPISQRPEDKFCCATVTRPYKPDLWNWIYVTNVWVISCKIYPLFNEVFVLSGRLYPLKCLPYVLSVDVIVILMFLFCSDCNLYPTL